jgi:hypothetical protein
MFLLKDSYHLQNDGLVSLYEERRNKDIYVYKSSRAVSFCLKGLTK